MCVPQASNSTPFSNPFSWVCLMARHLIWTHWAPCPTGSHPTYDQPFTISVFSTVTHLNCILYRDLAALTMWPFLATGKPCTLSKSDPTASTNLPWNNETSLRLLPICHRFFLLLLFHYSKKICSIIIKGLSSFNVYQKTLPSWWLNSPIYTERT